MSRIVVDSFDYGDPRIKEANKRIGRLIANAALRRVQRANREVSVTQRAERVDFDFPTWRVTARPFDWRIDGRNECGADWLDVERGEELAAGHGWA